MRQTRVERSPIGLFLLADPAGLTAPIRNRAYNVDKIFFEMHCSDFERYFCDTQPVCIIFPISGFFTIFFLGALVSKSDSKCCGQKIVLNQSETQNNPLYNEMSMDCQCINGILP